MIQSFQSDTERRYSSGVAPCLKRSPQKIPVQPQLQISVVDPDDDYLGIEVFASSGRYSGTTRLYAGDSEVAGMTAGIEGFPRTTQDEFLTEIGIKGRTFAGGYCSIRFYCADGTGRVAIDVDMEDDDIRFLAGSSTFTIETVATEIDRFVRQMQRLVQSRRGTACLKMEGEQVGDGDA
jgi:hypothetical protein